MASYETKIRELDVRFEVAIGAIEDESGELIIQLRKEREALMTTAGT